MFRREKIVKVLRVANKYRQSVFNGIRTTFDKNYIKYDELKMQSCPYYGETSLYHANEMYGHEYVFKRYSKMKNDISAIIEHGLYFGQAVLQDELAWMRFFPTLITYSSMRLNVMKEVLPHKQIVLVGPYIHYANIDKTYEDSLRRKLEPGKILLYFPMHSTGNIDIEYDVSRSLHIIDQLKSSYNCKNVIVCMYWKDIFRNVHLQYIQNNCVVATCGYMTDPHFLDKLKTLICISDYTASNNIGTHLGYCIYLNKPHVVCPQEQIFIASKKALIDEFDRGDNWARIRKQEQNEMFKLFSEAVWKPTRRQLDFCNYYWGFEHVKKADEFRELLVDIRNSYKRMS